MSASGICGRCFDKVTIRREIIGDKAEVPSGSLNVPVDLDVRCADSYRSTRRCGQSHVPRDADGSVAVIDFENSEAIGIDQIRRKDHFRGAIRSKRQRHSGTIERKWIGRRQCSRTKNNVWRRRRAKGGNHDLLLESQRQRTRRWWRRCLSRTGNGIAQKLTIQRHRRGGDRKTSAQPSVNVAPLEIRASLERTCERLNESPFGMNNRETVVDPVVNAVGRRLRYVENMAFGKHFGGLDHGTGVGN